MAGFLHALHYLGYLCAIPAIYYIVTALPNVPNDREFFRHIGLGMLWFGFIGAFGTLQDPERGIWIRFGSTGRGTRFFVFGLFLLFFALFLLATGRATLSSEIFIGAISTVLGCFAVTRESLR